MQGTFRYFDFDVTGHVSFTKPNTILVQMYRPHDRVFPLGTNDTDLSVSFIDWAPHPQDGSMGLWREIIVETTSAISVRYPLVSTQLTEARDHASLTVMLEAQNWQNKVVEGVVEVILEDIGTVSKTLTFQPNEVKQVVFTPQDFPILNVNEPVLWWPWQMGDPKLFNITITSRVGKTVSDSSVSRFGIRTVTDEVTPAGYRLYKVNGLPLLIRGAGWSPDLFLRTTPERQRQEFEYMRHMHLNAVRLEGKFDDDTFFDLADEFGILALPGWACCDAWQNWKYWDDNTLFVAGESLRSQVKRLRIHASILVFLYSSDELPPAYVETEYLKVFKEEQWPNCMLSSAANVTSSLTGPSGVKMSGPYSWEPPNYFYHQQLGGAFGFLTEGGPGENPLTLESLQLTIPKDQLWPINSYWDYHCANPAGLFHDLRFFTPPLEARYGAATSAYDYLKKSQVQVYESHRAMFEAYTRNGVPLATGVIQWMLNNAWPSNVWHLYDSYLNPSASYFATRKACELLHILFSHDDYGVWVSNSAYKAESNLVTSVQIFSLEGDLLYRDTKPLSSINGNSRVHVDTVDGKYLHGRPLVFLKLQILKQDGSVLSSNFYWISSETLDILDWKESTFYRTPCSSYTDFTALQKLPKLDLSLSFTSKSGNEGYEVTTVKVSNNNNAIAFFVRLRLVHKGKDVWPVLWDDNYFSLTPNETLIVDARYKLGAGELQEDVDIIVECFNN
eukprot:TRINITY_DN12975_c0_g1_i1.p1 TRINITY_DN12975_c0_g1~~TRINITY_DN12975_c0_g1_i1.p1  ORF type:complete len:849 (-),score=178.09 TRINITY_DN12975_c0_g1_i1:68-2257(-)